jgi:hypothetical protein
MDWCRPRAAPSTTWRRAFQAGEARRRLDVWGSTWPGCLCLEPGHRRVQAVLAYLDDADYQGEVLL